MSYQYTLSNFKLCSNSSVNSQTKILLPLNEDKINEIMTQCYEHYKKEYTGDRDFSVKSEDVTEEIDEIVAEFDEKLKKRNNILSSSIYSDLLDEFEIAPYNSTGNEEIEQNLEDKKQMTKVTRKFSDIQKVNRKLEIKTETEENDKVKEVQIEQPIDEKGEVEEDFKNLKNKTLNDDKSGVIDTSLFRVTTEDYELSQTNIRTVEGRSLYKERPSELLISQPHILMDSQISQNPYSLTNMFSRSENDDLFVFPKSVSGADEKNNNGKRPSFGDSIDMSFLKKEPSQLKFLPLDLPELDINHNSAREVQEIPFEKDEDKLLHENVHSNASNQNLPSDLSDYSPKFLTGLNISNSYVEDTISKIGMIEKYFEKIHHNKSINMKNYSFMTKISYSDLEVEDTFLEHFITLFELNNFLNEDLNAILRNQFGNRFEIYFFEVCRKFCQLKRGIYCDEDPKLISSIRSQIFKFLDHMNNLLQNHMFLMEPNDTAAYVFSPNSLLKFWDNTTEDLDLQTHSEIIKLFQIKTLLKKDRQTKIIIQAFSLVKLVYYQENMFDKSRVFIYYFGKLLRLITERISEITDEEILKMLSLQNPQENYKKIIKILKGFGLPTSNNVKKLGKNIENMARIGEHFFKDNNKEVDNFWKQAKRYFEFYNNPNKLTLTKESGMSIGTNRDSFSSS